MAGHKFSYRAPAVAPHLKHFQDAARLLGLKRPPAAELELADVAARGLPAASLVSLSENLGWTRALLMERLGIAPRTAARRLRGKAPLSAAESERAVRLARVVARATEIFETRSAAQTWLLEKSQALGGRAPLDLLSTEIGAGVVFNELGKIDHGFFA